MSLVLPRHLSSSTRRASCPGPRRTLLPAWILGLLLLVQLPRQSGAQTHYITGSSPATNATALAPYGPVRVDFSQPVPAAAASAISVFGSQYQGRRSGAYSGTGTTAVSFRPGRAFAPGEVISLSVPASVADVSGAPNTTPRVYQFTAAAPAGNGAFLQQPPIMTRGWNSINGIRELMATGDIDNDGDLDLLTPVYDLDSVTVNLNDGVGGFAIAPSIPAPPGGGPVQTSLADVDADGDLDLLVLCQRTNLVQLYRNNGSGGFTRQTATAVGPMPSMLQLADLDADGDLDFVTTNYASTTVSVRLNNGAGTFSNAPDISLRNAPTSVAIGDVNRDGALDLVVGHGPVISACLNIGNGQFVARPELAMGTPNRLVLADLNRDGVLDVITQDWYGTLYVRPGASNGTFGTMTTLPSSSYHGGLCVADVDADGDLDVVSASYNAAYVFVNTGSGTLVPTLTLPVHGNSATSVVCGDVDGDGDLDLLANNYLGHRITAYLNRGAPPVVRILGDSLVCGNRPVQLTAQTTAAVSSYRWSTGATTASITVTQPGTYSVTTTFGAGQTASATFLVRAFAPTVQVRGDSLLCPGGTATLTAQDPGATSYLWSTGATTPTLRVTQPGTYSVTVRYGGGCPATAQYVVRAPSLRIQQFGSFCVPGGSVGLQAVAPGATSYQWSTGANTPTVSALQPGSYSVTATFGNGCQLSATTTLTRPDATIQGDTILCPGQTVTLTASLPWSVGTLYPQWSTGATTTSIIVSQPGLYSVLIPYGPANCAATGQIRVRAGESLPFITLGPDTTICENDELLLRAPSLSVAGTLRWSDGSTGPTLRVGAAGRYSLSVTNACGTSIAYRQVERRSCVFIPNVVTPNGDGQNDQFAPQRLPPGPWTLEIYSRWGQLVFRSPDYRNAWGPGAAPGVYYYLLRQAGAARSYKGWVEVMR